MQLSLVFRWIGVIAVAGLLVAPGWLPGQVKDNGPTSLVITYRCPPEKRPELRAFMETRGVGQFERWKQQAVFQDYQVLFSPYAASAVGAFDLMVIVDFAHYTDLVRWKEIERQMPGGLSPEGLSLAVPVRTALTYPVCRAAGPKRDAARSAYVIGLYTRLVNNAEYERYATGYVEPQLRGWMQSGTLSAYTMYQTQPYQEDLEESPWTSLLLLEYTTTAALADSEKAKREVRRQLAGDAAWKALSDTKERYRKAKGFVFVDLITPPAPEIQGN